MNSRALAGASTSGRPTEHGAPAARPPCRCRCPVATAAMPDPSVQRAAAPHVAAPPQQSAGARFVAAAAPRPEQARAASASISRTMITSSAAALRHVLSRPAGVAGGAFGVVVVSILMMIVTRIARVLMRITRKRLRSCDACGGFGIERCSMCLGQAAIGWGGKWNHALVCPKCHGTRFTACEACHGLTGRRLFKHRTRRPRKSTSPPPTMEDDDGLGSLAPA